MRLGPQGRQSIIRIVSETNNSEIGSSNYVKSGEMRWKCRGEDDRTQERKKTDRTGFCKGELDDVAEVGGM